MKKVLVLGTFDLVHAGHIHLFDLASRHGQLHVGIAHDGLVRAFKGADRPIYNMVCREYIVRACRFVHETHIYGNESSTRENNAPEQIKLVQAIQPDIFVQGEDKDKNPDLSPFLEDWGIPRISTPRIDIENVSTTAYLTKILLGTKT